MIFNDFNFNMKLTRWQFFLLAILGLSTVGHGQELGGISGVKVPVELAREASAVRSEVGVLGSLCGAWDRPWVLGAEDVESRYLLALSRASLQCGDGELELLHFVEQYPHSSYIDRAMVALGGLYYASGAYSSAAYWLRKANRTLLPEDLCAEVEYRLGYALMREGQDREALSLFEPLTYYEKRRADALFYVGYLSMKGGALAKGSRYLGELVSHPKYGSYALGYLGEARLSEGRYDEALQLAERGLSGSYERDRGVVASLCRTAGLATSALGRSEASVRYLEQYLAGGGTPGGIELLTLGKELLALGRYGDAEGYLLQVGESGLGFMSQLALYYAGLCRLSERKLGGAIDLFDRASAMATYAPITEVSAYNAALASYAGTPGRLGDGTRRLARFLDSYPQSSFRGEVIGYLEEAYFHEPNNGAVLKVLEEFSPLPPELVRVRDRVKLRRAGASLASGDVNVASQQYDELIKSGSDAESVAEAYLWKGEAAYRAKEYGEAIRNTEQYLKLRPSGLPLNPNAYYTLGYACYNLGRYGEAEEWLKRFERELAEPTPDQRSAVNCRLGDIALQRRAYDAAVGYYQRAEQAGGREADHALFSRAKILGLQKKHREKATLLALLPERYPTSPLVDEALYEQGRSCQLVGDVTGAEKLYSRFLKERAESLFAPKVALQLALTYYGENRLEEAVPAYERVVRSYPRSGEAKSALQDLKSISIQLNRVDEYSRLVQETGSAEQLSSMELDSLAYLAAEGVVARGNSAEGAEALEAYLRSYPNGAFVDKAYYSQALLNYQVKRYDDVVRVIGNRVQHFKGKLAEDSYRLLASSYDKLNEPGRAAEAYLSLANSVSDRGQRSTWVIASAERAERSGSVDFAISLAEEVAKRSISVTDEAAAKVYLTASKFAALQNSKSLALRYAKLVMGYKDFGGYAIARTILALDIYDQGNYKGARDEMQQVTKRGMADPYWLARAYILLSDCCEKMGDRESALVYLESVKSNYSNRSDGILKMIDTRLERLK